MEKEYTVEKIKEIAIQFTHDTLGLECCHKLCYAISYPLHIHLSNINIPNSFKAAKIDGIGHYWVSLDSPYELSIDATARQFNPELDYVHFGELTKEAPNNFEEAFIRWFSNLIIYNRFVEELKKPEERMAERPTETYIKIGVKAALILIKDNKRNESNMNYIKAICQVSGNFYRQHPEKLADIEDANKVFQYCSENII